MINNINSISFGAKIYDVPYMKAAQERSLDDIKLKGYTALIGADVYTPSNKIVKQDLLFNDNTLVAIDDFEPSDVDKPIQYVMLHDKTIAPAIVDEHIHGGYGVNFHTSSEKEIRQLLKRLGKEGTAAVVATTLPGELNDIKNQIKILNRIIRKPDRGAAKIIGIHLEGPFLNSEKAGIHQPNMFSAPTIENYLALDPENVRIVTIAPEKDKNYELSHYLKDNGVIVSAGHSAAKAEDVKASGATQVTHIFNAMSQLHHRNPTIANEGLQNPGISAEMLADLSHLTPDTMNMVMKIKPKSKIILISDALPNAGDKKEFKMNGVQIYVNDNWEAKSAAGTLAGNMQFLHNVAKKLIDNTIMTFKDFIRFASVNPSRNLKIQDNFMLKKDMKPNFTVWDNETLTPEKTFIC